MALETIEPQIVVPTLDQAGEIARLRRELYREELITSGIDAEDAWVHTVGWGTPSAVEGYREYMEEWLADPKHYYYRVVMMAGQLAGRCLGYRARPDEKDNFFASIQLVPSARGTGVADRLLEEYDRHSDQTKPTRLHVFPGNARAHAFYSRIGFTQTEGSWIDSINNKEVILDIMQRPRRSNDEI